MSQQGQYAQMGRRPKHPGSLANYKRKFAADLVGISEQEIQEQWRELIDEFEQYYQANPRPKHPGTLEQFKSANANLSAPEQLEKYHEALEAYEDSREPSTDAEYYTDDGTPIVLVDDTVNPRSFKWFKAVLEDAGLYSPSNDLGLSDAEVHRLWKLRT